MVQDIYKNEGKEPWSCKYALQTLLSSHTNKNDTNHTEKIK